MVSRQSGTIRQIEWSVSMLALLLVFILSCGWFHTRIGDILEHPRDYDGKTVTVSGTVSRAIGLGSLRTFVLADGTGSIRVVTERAVPRDGEHVRVHGRVKQSFVILDESLVVIHEEPAE
jgi:aspartyl/asparaginyl-tRNA synthetase